MTFRANMKTMREGILVLDDLHCRAWNGVVADLWHARLNPGARGEYVSPHPRMFILLEETGTPFQTLVRPGGGAPSGLGQLSYIPAGMPLWTQSDDICEIRHLDLHFDPAMLAERLGEDLDATALDTPRLRFSDERVMGIARIIADECRSNAPRHDLYGEGLALALMIDVLAIGRKLERRRTPLTDWQMRRVTEFMEANCERAIRLQELAALVDLSQSYFSHAFKATTGMPPYQWQMNARIRRVQHLLRAGERSVSEIAAATGFADQAHLTRAFRRAVGEPPATWQRRVRGG
ncbi:helix-turn-helix domain-containing protein [Terrihabitans sp. B22-R8]|uniref:helix-turn-helix domain-containing protein n=1 Tax=Terrihabitans sp. B22-R8 TaxID=3425128 RepID=UPI00403D4060